MSAHNSSPEVRAEAILELCSKVAAGTADEIQEGKFFMAESTELLVRDLAYLSQRAAAAWKPAFTRVLDDAHSLRVVRVPLGEKEKARQAAFHCDACGRREKWCGLAVDLAGGIGQNPDWVKTCPSKTGDFGGWISNTENFVKEYQTDFVGEEGHLLACDFGRFYLGQTCSRKAQLAFIANSTVTETIYNAHVSLGDDAGDNGDDANDAKQKDAVAFQERLEKLKMCVADERRADLPDLLLDSTFWDRVDYYRLANTTQEGVRERAGACLDWADSGPGDYERRAKDDKDDGDWIGGGTSPSQGRTSDDGDESDFVVSDFEEKPGEKPVEDGAEGVEDGVEDELEDEIDPPAVAVARARARAGDGSDDDAEIAYSKRRRTASRHVDDGEDGDAETVPPSAARKASSLPVPASAPSSVPLLGARRSLLLNLLTVQRELVLKEEDGLASIVGAAVLTIQEILPAAKSSDDLASGQVK